MDRPAEKRLTGGFITSSVTRSGDTVRRTAGAWSPAVHVQRQIGYVLAHRSALRDALT